MSIDKIQQKSKEKKRVFKIGQAKSRLRVILERTSVVFYIFFNISPGDENNMLQRQSIGLRRVL